MAGRDRFVAIGIVLVEAACAAAQNGSTFAYTGTDAAVDALNTHSVNYGGFTNSFLVSDNQLLFPWLPALTYERGYLLRPENRGVNVCVTGSPSVFLDVLFMFRLQATADLVLLNEASNKAMRGVGFRLGGGFSMLGSTFGLSENTPLLRAGMLVGNIRLTYAYGLKKGIFVNHEIGVVIKFDW